jgi:hypothetical protein
MLTLSLLDLKGSAARLLLCRGVALHHPVTEDENDVFDSNSNPAVASRRSAVSERSVLGSRKW